MTTLLRSTEMASTTQWDLDELIIHLNLFKPNECDDPPPNGDWFFDFWAQGDPEDSGFL